MLRFYLLSMQVPASRSLCAPHISEAIGFAPWPCGKVFPLFHFHGTSHRNEAAPPLKIGPRPSDPWTLHGIFNCCAHRPYKRTLHT